MGVQAVQLRCLVLLYALVSIAGIEGHEATHHSQQVHDSHAPHKSHKTVQATHHSQQVHDSHAPHKSHKTVQATLDDQGKAHILRREVAAEPQDHKANNRKVHKHHHHIVDAAALVSLADGPDEDVGPGNGAAQPTQASGKPVQPIDDLNQAEAEAKKFDEVVVAAEEKAGLPDSTKTTPEPNSEEPSNEDQEGNAMMIALISLVVLAGTASAGWSIWMARGVYAKHAAANDASGVGGEGEGESLTEAEAEAETAEAEQ
jgi:hypothetical protein